MPLRHLMLLRRLCMPACLGAGVAGGKLYFPVEALALDEHGDKDLVLMGIWEGSPEDHGGGAGFATQAPGSS